MCDEQIFDRGLNLYESAYLLPLTWVLIFSHSYENIQHYFIQMHKSQILQ